MSDDSKKPKVPEPNVSTSLDADSKAIPTLEYADKKREFELRLKDFKQNMELKKSYAEKSLIFVIVWCVSVLAIVVSTGLGWLKLNDWVLAVLLGTTTTNVIFIVRIIISSLFQTK